MRFQHRSTVQGVTVVDEAAGEAYTLTLPPLADARANRRAIQLVRGPGDGLDVRVSAAAPVKHVPQQGVAVTVSAAMGTARETLNTPVLNLSVLTDTNSTPSAKGL